MESFLSKDLLNSMGSERDYENSMRNGIRYPALVLYSQDYTEVLLLYQKLGVVIVIRISGVSFEHCLFESTVS